jgi:hypothetical protein
MMIAVIEAVSSAPTRIAAGHGEDSSEWRGGSYGKLLFGKAVVFSAGPVYQASCRRRALLHRAFLYLD